MLLHPAPVLSGCRFAAREISAAVKDHAEEERANALVPFLHRENKGGEFK